MDEKEKFDEVGSRVLGDKTLRIRRRPPRRRLRITPNIPAVLRFLGDVVTKTPLIPLLLALVALWLLSSWAIYLIERSSHEQLSSYAHALWWSFTAMQTQGANAPGPITHAGMAIGAIWSIFSTIAFFGVIIGTLYSYYMLPRRSPSRELIGAIQYNLDELEHLSIDELEALKQTTVNLVDAQISRRREGSPSH
jgi:voltage-gated potassium channel